MITYIFEKMHLIPYNNTYRNGVRISEHLNAYYIFFNRQSSLQMYASLIQRSSLPSLRMHVSHLLSTHIIRPINIYFRSLSYIGTKLYNTIKSSMMYTK